MPASSEKEPAVHWRSPGKLVLVGEYAVLDGAPALVAAVDRGVDCLVSPLPSPPLLGAPIIETPDGDDRFVRPALMNGPGTPPALYRFSAWNPVEGIDGKPGFGGSAAACVVACLAAGRPAEDAYAIHRAVQGGGSGIDVAASIHGGILCFTLHGPSGFDQSPVDQRALPPMVVLWSGRSASTGPRVAQYRAWADRVAFVRDMRAIVESWPEDPIHALGAAAELLIEMSVRAGIDYLSPAHARIRGLAADFGGAAKPSGAGGGDIAVALFPDPGSALAFGVAAAGLGFPPIPVSVAGGAFPVRPETFLNAGGA